MAQQHSKSSDQYLGRQEFEYLIVVCAGADTACPRTFPGVRIRWFWPFEDPAECQGTEQEQLAVFRTVRDQIEQQVRSMVAVANATPCCEAGASCISKEAVSAE